MRRPRGFLLGLVLLGCADADPTPGATATPELPAAPTVIIAVIDGARSQETLGDRPSSATGEMPWQILPTVWDDLVPQGVRATSAWVLTSSTTVPAHAAMLMGRREPVANYPPADGPGAYLPPLPTVGQALRMAEPGLGPAEVYTVANTELLALLEGSQWPGAPAWDADAYRFVDDGSGADGSRDDAAVIAALEEAMAPGGTRLALINLHQVDRSGHNGTWDEYPDKVRALDRPLVALWEWLQAHEAYQDRSYLLVLADHGRHNAGGTEPPWRHHGCSCSGCRHVPLLLLGPGVRAGEERDAPLLLTDVGPTVAALLGVPLPWADGLVRDDLLLTPTGATSRRGLADLALAGAHRAELHYRQDPGQRARLLVDGVRLSSPDALLVEAPSLATEGGHTWACWRELAVPQGERQVEWEHHCAEDDGEGWQALDFAVGGAGPYGRVELRPTDAGLLAAWIHNTNGSTSGGSADPGDDDTTVSLRVALRAGEGWVEARAPSAPSFPTDTSVLVDGARARIAMAGGRPDSGNAVRDRRRIWLAEVDLAGDEPVVAAPEEVDLEAVAPAGLAWRVEHPALALDAEGALLLAATGYAADGTSQAIVARRVEGEPWEPTTLAVPAPPVPNLAPVWLGERAIFVTVDPTTQAAALCAGGVDGAVACLDPGTDRVLRLLVEDETVHALVDAGEGAWEHRQWKATGFEAR